ncbi:MAG: hypothetical protein HC918_11285 [Oscillatoriales cyanobacterium SM2_1_8]|nr:hypothetical protein [Oscillatoriales cyanobacterium SM2_1_8]
MDEITLEDVVEALEQDENVLRIKRLVVFASHGFWVTEADDLAAMDTRRLVEELLVAVPNLGDLKQKIQACVRQLNKPGVYALVADAIVDSIGLLYPSDGSPAVSTAVAWAGLPEAGDELTVPGEPLPERPTQLPDGFDLRLEVANTVSPLRLKVLLFSLLHRPFDPEEKDWHEFNGVDVGALLDALWSRYSDFAALEKRLYASAEGLREPQEYRQVASTLLRSLRSRYESP